MRKQKFIAVLTAAATALSSVAAFPSAAFAASEQETNLFVSDTSNTGTEKYTFDYDRLSYDISQNPIFTVGYEPFEEDYYIGDWPEWNPDAFEGISTIEDFVSKYGSLEMKFRAEDIQGDAEVYAVIEVGDESRGESQQILFPAQDIIKGQNVYTVNFVGNIKAEYSAFRSVSVHFRSKTKGETATFMLGLYNSFFAVATGTETFKSGIDTDEDFTVIIKTPEWWNPEWGSMYMGIAGSWYYGMGEGINTCLANTIPELYSTYKGGEITFNVRNLSTDVTYNLVLQTRDGDEYGEEFVLSYNNKLQNGLNTVKFDLPKIMYVNPDIWGICMYFNADKATEFTISNAESSNPSTSEPETSEPATSEPTTPDTNEVFKTEEKPIEDIMDEVKSDTTASIEVAAEDTAIKADVFEAAKDKNVTLELTLENGVKWEIKADSIGDDTVDVNINVELNTSNVPAASVEAVAEGKTTMQISLAHNGSFGFEANITIPVAPANNGKVANLFHFNNGTLEFVASVTVSNGEATLPFSHASEYVIVFDEKSMGDSETNPSTGAAGVGVFAALAAVSAAAVIICRKNKHN